MEPTLIGAIAGGILGLAFIAIIITCIVFVTKRMRKRTNYRSKLITSNGDVINQKWAANERKGGYHGEDHDRRMYFDNVNRTEHVEVKEKRKDYVLPPMLPRLVPPPPPPPVMIVPPPAPRPPPPRFTRFQFRSLPRRKQPPTFRRRPSFNEEHSGGQYFMYGYQAPKPPVTSATYGTWIPPVSQAAPPPEPPAPKGVEEQERVLVVDDLMTEKSFNPRWQGVCQTTATASNTLDLSHSHTAQIPTTNFNFSTVTREVPRIVTEVI